MRILVIDDDATTADLLTALLEMEGHYARFEGDGLAALTYLAAPSFPLPDVIVLDLRMPGMDGLELLERLQEREEWRSIPVILTSATSLDEQAHARQQWPRLKLLSKPFDPAALLALLETIGEKAAPVCPSK